MLTPLDYAVIAIYFVAITLFGIKAAGRQESQRDYFLGGRDMPWWAICFSIVATETSTLTVIGVPAIAYAGTFTFLQIAFGYLIGRVLVSLILLPKYYEESLTTAYAFLGNRFGSLSQASASVTFLITRLLADGVRLFATAIPIKIIFLAADIDVSYFLIIVIIGLLTIIYTSIGGLRAVVWMDSAQLMIYLIGAVITVIVLSGQINADWMNQAMDAGKLKLIDLEIGRSFNVILTSPYAFITATIGGGIFTMASHGTDQLIVQRLLACKSLKDSKKALIGSGFVVLIQFGLFLVVGLLLWVHYEGAAVADMGLSRTDEVYPRFIIEGLPPGVSGFILAGIIAAAMSTLSSSLNALASSTLTDLYAVFSKKELTEKGSLRMARVFTLFWGIVFIFFASLFENQQNPVVELGLAIATFTYGGLLGAFALGFLNKSINDKGASLTLLLTVISMSFIIFGVKYADSTGWFFSLGSSAEASPADTIRSIAWPLYTLLGALISLVVGWVLSRFALFRNRNR